jgi:hypothetical protein
LNITPERVTELQAIWNDGNSDFENLTEDEFALIQCCAMDAIITHIQKTNPMAFDGADLLLQ